MECWVFFGELFEGFNEFWKVFNVFGFDSNGNNWFVGVVEGFKWFDLLD